jgi:hypothetical protein
MSKIGVIQKGLEDTEFPTFEKEGTKYVDTGEKHKGCTEVIQSFDSMEQAQANADERNRKAEEMGLAARYEAVTL